MKTLQNLIGDQTYQVIDSPDNRYNFFGLVEVDGNLIEVARTAEYYNEWSLTGALPEDVKRAIAVMAENGADVDNFSGVATFAHHEYLGGTYYLLTW